MRKVLVWGGRRGTEERRRRILVYLILVWFILIGLVYSWTIPPFEGPDEPQHYAYIYWVSEQGEFPPLGDEAWETPVQQESGQPPFYYLIASKLVGFLDLDEPEKLYTPNPHAFSGPDPRQFPDNENRAIHNRDEEEWLAPGGYRAVYLARLLSLGFGTLLLISIYGLSRQLLPGSPNAALLAMLLVAVTPQVVYMSNVVSNDIPAAALSTLTLWLIAVMSRRDFGWRLPFCVGLVFGLAAITKVSALALGLPLILAFGWLWLSRRLSFAKVNLAAMTAAAGALVVAGPWFARTWLRYNSPFGLEPHDKTPWAITNLDSLPPLLERWKEVFRSYWIALGWGTLRPDQWVYSVLFVLAFSALLGLGVAIRRWLRRGARFRTTEVLWLSMILTPLVVAAFLELWMRRVTAPYGRLLFPAIGPCTVALIAGWSHLHPKFPALPIAMAAILTVLSPSLLIAPSYSAPRSLTESDVAAIRNQLDWRFWSPDGRPVAELLSARSLEDSIVAGETLDVEVCWKALARAKRQYTVLVHIIGPENRLIANRRTYPGLGRYPMTFWTPNTAFCDVVPVWVPVENVERTLVYTVEIGVLDEARGERLQAYGVRDEPLEATFVDHVRIIARTEPQQRFEATKGSPLQLVDYKLDRAWHPGETAELTLRWGVAHSVDRDYQVFVHLLNSRTHEIITQADGPPFEGWYPTSWWPAGAIVVEQRRFVVPSNLPSGRYDLLIGFYDLQSGIRLAQGYHLGPVEVRLDMQ